MNQAGGAQEIRVYPGMTLTEGDHIRTGAHATVVLRLADRDDVFTISANTELYISALAWRGGGKASKLDVWSGSLYVKAESMLGSADTLAVQLLNRLLHVRGTHFLVGVDGRSGDTSLSVLAGLVEGELRSSEPNGDDQDFSVYPTQQAHLFSTINGDTPPPVVTMVDPIALVNGVDEDVIQAILRNRNLIDEENTHVMEQILAGLRQQGFFETDADLAGVADDELARLQHNLKNLVGIIVRNAMNSGRIDEQHIARIIDELNRQNPDRPLDLNDVPPLAGRGGEEGGAARRRLELEQQRREYLAEQRQREREQAERNRELLSRLQQQRQQQDEANRAAANKSAQEAIDHYREQLTEEAQREFDQRLREREAERERAEAERQRREARNQPEPEPAPLPPPSRPGGSGNSGDSEEPDTEPEKSAQPDVWPAPGLVEEGQTIAMSVDNPDATIVYKQYDVHEDWQEYDPDQPPVVEGNGWHGVIQAREPGKQVSDEIEVEYVTVSAVASAVGEGPVNIELIFSHDISMEDEYEDQFALNGQDVTIQLLALGTILFTSELLEPNMLMLTTDDLSPGDSFQIVFRSNEKTLLTITLPSGEPTEDDE